MPAKKMSIEDWLTFFEKPDVMQFCNKMAENMDDLAPKLVFADWLEENCPDTQFVEAYRKHLDAGCIETPVPESFEVAEKDLGYEIVFKNGGLSFNSWDFGWASDIQRFCETGIVFRVGESWAALTEINHWPDSMQFVTTFHDQVEDFLSTGNLIKVQEIFWHDSYRGEEAVTTLLCDPNICNLEVLYLSGLCPESPQIIESNDLQKMKRLVIGGQYPCSEEMLRKLGEATNLPNLTELDLGDSEFAGQYKEGVIQTFVNSKLASRLTKLALPLSQLNQEELTLIANTANLKNLTHLEEVSEADRRENIKLSPSLQSFSPDPNKLRIPKLPKAHAEILAESPYLQEHIRRQFRPKKK